MACSEAAHAGQPPCNPLNVVPCGTPSHSGVSTTPLLVLTTLGNTVCFCVQTVAPYRYFHLYIPHSGHPPLPLPAPPYYLPSPD